MSPRPWRPGDGRSGQQRTNEWRGGPAAGGSLSAAELLAEFEGRRGAPRRTVAALLQRLDANGRPFELIYKDDTSETPTDIRPVTFA